MPSGSPWVDLPDGTGNGNPTRHKSINKLIADMIQFEIRDEGAEGRDVRDMTVEEFQKEMELFHEHKDPICRYRNTLMGLYQFQFITRCDDVCNFKVEDPKSHPNYDMALSQKVKWSKNVRDARNCPDQLLLASKEHRNCLFLALGLWLEHFLRIHPEATYMMTAALPEGKTKKQHKKFTSAISKTYKNNWLKWVVMNESFKRIYRGKDKTPLGLHSKRKMGSTQAKRRGVGSDQIDHRGRWVSKKGSKIVNKVYIDPEDLYADAFCASVLALGGPVKYKLKQGLAGQIDTRWLADNVVPHIAKRFADDEAFVSMMGICMLWLALDDEAADDLALPKDIKNRVRDAYSALAINNKLEQPAEKIPLHVYRHGEDTVIEEILPTRGALQEQQQPQGTNVAEDLARLPVAGAAAQQHVLQTLVIQVRNVQQQLVDLQQQQNQNDQWNRAWLEGKLRIINNNITRFGGTIQGGLLRQDPRRQEEVRRYRREGPHVAADVGRRGRVWPTLAPNIRDLMTLWTEWEYGIAGRKAAKSWTSVERGAGGNAKVKQMYHRRRNIWAIQQRMINKGRTIYEANRIIESTYGANLSITALSMAIADDRKRYAAHGGIHPNFR